MKKILLILISIVAICIAVYLIPVTKSDDIVVQNNFDNVLSLLNTPGKWEKWHPFAKDLSTKNSGSFHFIQDQVNHRCKFINTDDSLIIESINPLIYDVQQYDKKKFSSYSYIILPSLTATNVVTIRVTEKIRLFYCLFPFYYSSEGESALLSLKGFLENSKEVYGYDIKVENVKDTVFAVEMLTIAKKDNFFKILPEEFVKIEAFVKEHSLTQTNFASVSYIENNDSIQLILGIPVNRFVTNNTKIHCVNIPKGRMLTGIYEGKFSDRQKIYQAFQKYAREHLLKNVGATFESYINNQLPLNDSSIVKFKIYYPIL